ncbi:hypothetical protein [Salipiger mucosus]|uniref:Uncharacterized protein n=1 Tax=Salipiger mucosus DSM 16094 TaxID=1123237 RepID=S9SAD7_9RHOB|nr:hypothetical protein [Salipiger mucosus]EPX87090.1 hypothetical protein Salmuc_00043 [Salipiger mucosus DSM 16094]
MKTWLRTLAVALALALPAAADAACYVEYKAKQDGPLRLHYGIALLHSATCPSRDSAAAQLVQRLDRNGWTLLTVIAVSTGEPSGKKKANAGDYYLRF